jgi:hypothetical protein
VQQLGQHFAAASVGTAPVPDLLSIWLRFVSDARSDRKNRVFPEADIGKRQSAEVERRAARRGNALDVAAGCAQTGAEPLCRHTGVGFLVGGVVQIPST